MILSSYVCVLVSCLGAFGSFRKIFVFVSMWGVIIVGFNVFISVVLDCWSAVHVVEIVMSRGSFMSIFFPSISLPFLFPDTLKKPGRGLSLCLLCPPTVEHKVNFVLFSSNLSLLPSFLLVLSVAFPRISSCSLSLTLAGVSIDKSDPDKVEALVGQTVVLPCRVSPPPSSTVVVEWRRDGISLSAQRLAPAQIKWIRLCLVPLCHALFLLSSDITSSPVAPCWSVLL